MKKIFNIIIALVFVMTTGCTSLSLHKNYNNSKKIQNTKNTQDAKLFCEAVHKDHKLDSSKTAIENCIVTASLTANFVEQNNKYKPLWWSLGAGVVTAYLIKLFFFDPAAGLGAK